MIWIRQGQAMGGAELSSKLLIILIGISQTSRFEAVNLDLTFSGWWFGT